MYSWYKFQLSYPNEDCFDPIFNYAYLKDKSTTKDYEIRAEMAIYAESDVDNMHPIRPTVIGLTKVSQEEVPNHILQNELHKARMMVSQLKRWENILDFLESKS